MTWRELEKLRRHNLDRFWLRRELLRVAGVFVGVIVLAGVLTTAQATLRQPAVLSKSGNTPAPMSTDWAKDRKGFIADCESHGGAAVPRAGIVGSDGLVCVALLGE